jgi:hypothetical protein
MLASLPIEQIPGQSHEQSTPAMGPNGIAGLMLLAFS